jgi:dephospho-CoA kinase
MVIGVTGGFCTGKSTVTKAFEQLGAKIIDLDKIAHLALKPNTATYKNIVKEFGSGILAGRLIDRSLLANKVFSNRSKLAKLNSIIHPVVIKHMLIIIKRTNKEKYVIAVEAPLLFEAGLGKYFDSIIVVKTNRKNQISRATRKTGLSRKLVFDRIHSQWPLQRKIKEADFVIDNNKSAKHTHEQAESIWDRLSL